MATGMPQFGPITKEKVRRSKLPKAGGGITAAEETDPFEQAGVASQGLGPLANAIGGSTDNTDAMSRAMTQRPMGNFQTQPTAPPQAQAPNLPPVPQLQQPSVWQRILSGVVGGAAGLMNTRAGRPGGIAAPIDPSAAEQGILGVSGYQRKLANWQNQVKALEYQDTLKEKQREADLRLAESQERMAGIKDQREAVAEWRKAQAQAALEKQHAAIEASLIMVPPTQNPSGNGEGWITPLAEQDVSAQKLPYAPGSREAEQAQRDAESLPLSMPRIPAPDLSTPGQAPRALTPGGFTPVNMPQWLQGQYPQGTQAFKPSPIEQQAQIAKAKLDEQQAGWMVVGPAMAKALNAKNIDIAAGEKIPPQNYNELAKLAAASEDDDIKPTGDFEKVFLPRFATELGKKVKDLTKDEVATAMGQFRSANQDPDMAALRQSSVALQNTLRSLQIGQQPTQAEAQQVADMLINHRIAPEQVSGMIGGFGTAGAAFKRMIMLEAAKIQPGFNFEEASAEYQLSKSASFQNTVRYMDSVQNSIPLVIQRAQELGNHGFKFGNTLRNLEKTQLQDPNLQKFKTDALLVSDEIAKILQGGGTGSGTSDAKLKQAAEIIDTSADPKVIAASLGEVQQLIGYRRDSLTRGTYLAQASPQAATEPDWLAKAPPTNKTGQHLNKQLSMQVGHPAYQ